MRAGKLRHYVELQSSTSTQDSYGQPVVTWSTYAKRWAWIKPGKATEELENGQFRTQRFSNVEMRYEPALVTTHRLKHDDRIFDITGIRNIEERDRRIVVNVTERL